MTADLEDKLEELLRRIDVDEEAERLRAKVVQLEKELAGYHDREKASIVKLLDKFKIFIKCDEDQLANKVTAFKEILSPNEIYSFLQATDNELTASQNYSSATGLVVSKLIQNSYNH